MLQESNPAFIRRGARRALAWASVALSLCPCLPAGTAHAQELTAIGRWRQISDTDNKPRSIVRIEEQAGRYRAVIERVFLRQGEDESVEPICDKCTDTRKDQKIIGMRIMSGMTRNGRHYEDGEILDPDEGKVYRARMTLAPDGRTLEVRGYIGISFFGRSQIWRRE